MNCSTQPLFLRNKPDHITELWEVRLPVKLWLRIQAIASRKKVTYSTITRYCSFMLAERSSLRGRKAIQKLVRDDRESYRQAELLHRHVACFYGEDVRMLRLAAMQLGVTVSCLIRIALKIFLRHFDMEKHSHLDPSEVALFWRGIKRAIHLIPHHENNHGSFGKRSFILQSFPPEMRWGWPSGEARAA